MRRFICGVLQIGNILCPQLRNGDHTTDLTASPCPPFAVDWRRKSIYISALVDRQHTFLHMRVDVSSSLRFDEFKQVHRLLHEILDPRPLRFADFLPGTLSLLLPSSNAPRAYVMISNGRIQYD